MRNNVTSSRFIQQLNTTTAVARNVILSDRRERRISFLAGTSSLRNKILRRFAPPKSQLCQRLAERRIPQGTWAATKKQGPTVSLRGGFCRSNLLRRCTRGIASSQKNAPRNDTCVCFFPNEWRGRDMEQLRMTKYGCSIKAPALP